MSLFDEGLDILMRKDPDFERNSKVSQAVAANINCYKEMYTLMKKKAVQQTLDKNNNNFIRQ